MGYFYFALAGLFWSVIGFFTTNLSRFGLSTQEISFLRLFIGFLMFMIYVLIKDPSLLKISKKGLFFSVAIGLLCQGLFNFCYVSSIKYGGSAVAAVLLYTSPIFLTIFSKTFYKEKINKSKILSLIVCLVATFLAVTGGSLKLQNISTLGIISGIIAAILYALMPILSKNILDEVNNLTLMIYSFLIGSIVFIPSIDFIKVCVSIIDISILPYIIGFGLFTCAFAYMFYTKGVQSGVELSVAGVIASVELVFAQIIGWTIMGEPFNLIKIFGICLMMVSAVIAIKGINRIPNESYEQSNVDLSYSSVANHI